MGYCWLLSLNLCINRSITFMNRALLGIPCVFLPFRQRDKEVDFSEMNYLMNLSSKFRICIVLMKSPRGDEKLWCSFVLVFCSVNFPILNEVLLNIFVRLS